MSQAFRGSFTIGTVQTMQETRTLQVIVIKFSQAKFWLFAQVINIRTLKPLDRDTIVNSVKKTHRVVAVEEGWPQCGVTSEIIATVNEECFDDLDAPPERITGAEVPMPYAANLEKAALPQLEDVIRVVKRVMGK